MVERSRSNNLRYILKYTDDIILKSMWCVFCIVYDNVHGLQIYEFNDKATWWPYSIIHTYVFTWSWLRHGFLFIFMVILRSTTGPYGRPMIEVAYGEMLLSLHRGCMGVDSSRRVVGMSTWCHPCWTYQGQH